MKAGYIFLPLITILLILSNYSYSSGLLLPVDVVVFRSSADRSETEAFPIGEIIAYLRTSDKLNVIERNVSNDINIINENIEALSQQENLYIIYYYEVINPAGQIFIALVLYNTDTSSLSFFAEYPMQNIESDFSSGKLRTISQEILNTILGVNFTIDCNTEGVEVYIDDVYIGKTPLYGLMGYIGQYSIYLYKDGYSPVAGSIELSENNQDFFYEMSAIEGNYRSYKISIYTYPFFQDFGQNTSQSVAIGYRFEVFDPLWDLQDLSYFLDLEVIQFSYNYSYNPIINGEQTTLSITGNKDFHLIPIFIGIKYHFLQWTGYFIPYVNAGFGINFAASTEDHWQKANMFTFGGAGFSLNPYPDFGIQIFADYRFFYAGNLTLNETTSWSMTEDPSVTDINIPFYGQQITLGLEYVF